MPKSSAPNYALRQWGRSDSERGKDALTKRKDGPNCQLHIGTDEGMTSNPQRWRYWDGKPDTVWHNWRLFRSAVTYADGDDGKRTELG